MLVWQAPTRTMNPTVPQSVIDRALARRSRKKYRRISRRVPIRHRRVHYPRHGRTMCRRLPRTDARAKPSLFRFRRSLGGQCRQFQSRDRAQGQATTNGRHRLHQGAQNPRSVRNTSSTSSRNCAKQYRINKIVGDRYAGEFPRELFRKHEIVYVLVDRVKSDLFRDFLPLLNSQKIVAPEQRTVGVAIGRSGAHRVTRGQGYDISIPNSHDDVGQRGRGGRICLLGLGCLRSRGSVHRAMQNYTSALGNKKGDLPISKKDRSALQGANWLSKEGTQEMRERPVKSSTKNMATHARCHRVYILKDGERGRFLFLDEQGREVSPYAQCPRRHGRSGRKERPGSFTTTTLRQ